MDDQQAYENKRIVCLKLLFLILQFTKKLICVAHFYLEKLFTTHFVGIGYGQWPPLKYINKKNFKWPK